MNRSSATNDSPDPVPSDAVPRGGQRRLILMRHAKSDWSGPEVADHDRQLNDRGRRDAPEMAQWLSDQGYRPDLILCSSATRTQQTADLMLQQWTNPPRLAICRPLYLSSPQTIFETLHTETIVADDDRSPGPKTILVLAHNPGISEAAGWLCGQMAALPTAALAVFRCQIESWNDSLNPKLAKMIAVMKPKALPQRDN
ncbi:SixA phosphatase family protein [Neorhodopirellula lusitana]|uniref:SixA phosphatase family protein n=1 Tax=Neorhodopirellula lusitana TaxID=445327 RepID=UPI00384BC92B